MKHHTIVKVCGLTRAVDARHALEAGADWLGFIVKANTPRSITPEAAGEILAELSEATGVAVMVAPTPDEALAIADRAHAKRVQIHGIAPADWPADFPLPSAVVVTVDASGGVGRELPRKDHLLFLDTANTGPEGGTGRPFPWRSVRRLAGSRDTMVAGGLGPENVSEALGALRPFGVDASSRLEREPGIKDPDAVTRYIAAVRTFDERFDPGT